MKKEKLPQHSVTGILQFIGQEDLMDVYLEIGKSRCFAGAIDWPGWCRIGRDEAAALQALVDYRPRYARVVETAKLGFQAPDDVSALTVVERLPGTATTDFGAPDVIPSRDTQPIDTADLERFPALLRACWQALGGAVQAAAGKELRKGPRGGGRDADAIVRHVLGAHQSYLSRLARKVSQQDGEDLWAEIERTQQATQEALAAAARGELPEKGPRGGTLWAPRYFVRRAAWHVLDHAWEIEDRAA